MCFHIFYFKWDNRGIGVWGTLKKTLLLQDFQTYVHELHEHTGTPESDIDGRLTTAQFESSDMKSNMVASAKRADKQHEQAAATISTLLTGVADLSSSISNVSRYRLCVSSPLTHHSHNTP